jgi:hypothetical protein
MANAFSFYVDVFSEQAPSDLALSSARLQAYICDQFNKMLA